MIIYGINAVHEALESDVKVKRVYVADRMDNRIRHIVNSAKGKGVRIVRKNKEFFRSMKAKTIQYIAADVDLKPVPFEDLIEKGAEFPHVYLVLDQVEDPRNLGAIIRSAAASGVSGIVIQTRRSCGLTSAVFSASAGTVAHVKVSEVPNIKNALRVFKDEGYQIVGTDARSTQLYWEVDYSVNTVFVMGSEGKGLRKTVRDLCDVMVKIPMDKKVASLNVSVATGVLLYEVTRQKTV
jgi:23S rRNA (guanosine2251-2'-O)-methyltransferase